jgi:hypothetical protein
VAVKVAPLALSASQTDQSRTANIVPRCLFDPDVIRANRIGKLSSLPSRYPRRKFDLNLGSRKHAVPRPAYMDNTGIILFGRTWGLAVSWRNQDTCVILFDARAAAI